MGPSQSSKLFICSQRSRRHEVSNVETLEVADTACTVAVSLDGVMAPMKTGGGGYREASCASVSLYDGEGERLSTVRMARMPESKKVTLKTMVGAEVEAVLGQRPDLQLVKIADGANDNWTFLSPRVARGRRAHRLLPRRAASQRDIQLFRLVFFTNRVRLEWN